MKNYPIYHRHELRIIVREIIKFEKLICSVSERLQNIQVTHRARHSAYISFKCKAEFLNSCLVSVVSQTNSFKVAIDAHENLLSSLEKAENIHLELLNLLFEEDTMAETWVVEKFAKWI